MFNLYSEDYAAVFYNIIGGQNTQMTCYYHQDCISDEKFTILRGHREE